MSSRRLHQNKEATVYAGNLSDHVTEEILFELFSQCGPVVHLNIPRDRLTNHSNGYGFIEFSTPDDAKYASAIMNEIPLYGTPIRTSLCTTNKEDEVDVGARLYIGNLAPDVTDLTLRTLFQQFGTLINCRVAIDQDTGESRGHGFVTYDNFTSADNARAALHMQYVSNQPITVTYAFKADSKSGEQHGDKSERLIAPSTKAKRIQNSLLSQQLRAKD